ncbi:hypothetical protein Pmani_009726 [Petrolisthes manimaculis]|uniref:C2H2-type domain-containing protein n=1 Tax=Petrolisthes manimaculis TaxID=1843537 RepID=A0AAE1UCL2_9EUCA|nr:hypothetical protein Pmani_009726 [Petrolisthes manimaculis]
MCLYIQPKRRPQGQKVTKRLNVEKLKSPDVIHELQAAINDKLSVPLTTSDTIEDQWAHLRDSTYSIALEIIGPKNKKHQDWFDENDSEIQPLLEEKRQLLRAHQSDPRCVAKKAAFTNIRSKVQARLRSMQDAWLSAKADEIQEHADNHDVRKFYEALRAVYGPQSSGSSPLLSSDGTTLLNDKKQILYRWAEHFNSVLNRPSTINDEAINQLRQEPINEELDIPPSSEEVSKAIKQLSSGKAPGPDSIPAEVYISGGPTLLSWESRAAERSAWRCAISLGADRAEDQRATHAQRKRERRKERTAGAQPANPAFTCPECGRVCRARIGLISHLRTHRPPTPN